MRKKKQDSFAYKLFKFWCMLATAFTGASSAKTVPIIQLATAFTDVASTSSLPLIQSDYNPSYPDGVAAQVWCGQFLITSRNHDIYASGSFPKDSRMCAVIKGSEGQIVNICSGEEVMRFSPEAFVIRSTVIGLKSSSLQPYKIRIPAGEVERDCSDYKLILHKAVNFSVEASSEIDAFNFQITGKGDIIQLSTGKIITTLKPNQFTLVKLEPALNLKSM